MARGWAAMDKVNPSESSRGWAAMDKVNPSESSRCRVSDGQSQSIGILLLQFFFVPYIHLVKVYTIKIKTLDFFRRPRILFAN